MLVHSLRDLRRGPRRALVSVAGVALGVGLFTAIILFVSASAATMTARAIAPVAVDMYAQVTSPLDSNVSLERTRARIAALPGIASADRMGIGDLPEGALRAGGAPLSTPLRVFALDPSFLVHHHDAHLTSGVFGHGGVMVSDEASADLRIAPGASVELTVPGGTAPIPLQVGGVADLSGAASLFASRSPDTLGDFIYVPDSLVVSPEVFESAVLPALRVDAAAPDRVVMRSPFLEVDVMVDRSRLATGPATALARERALAGSLDRVAPGGVAVVDNLADTLTAAHGDAVAGTVMFLLLGLPGVLLAAFLSAYAGGLVARAVRRENAILRTRGAQPGHLLRLLAYRTAVIAGGGSLCGLGIGYLAVAASQGWSALATVPAGDLVRLSLLAVAAGVVTTALALLVPGRRALRREVVEEGRELESAAPPLWRRWWLDAALLVAAAVVEALTFVVGGFTPTQAEGAAVSLAFATLLPPVLAWFGGSLLAVRILTVLASRVHRRGGDRYGTVVGGTLVRSLRRRPRTLAAGVVSVSLALALGVSVAVFIASYDSQKAADARYTVGGDLRVTPSPLSPQAPAFASRLRIPGVVAASPVEFRIADAVFNGDTKDMAGIDASSIGRTATLPDAFFLDGSAAEAMAALRENPTGILVDHELAHDFGIRVGDPVRVQITDAAGETATTTFHSVGRFLHFPGFPQNADLVANLDLVRRATGRADVDFFVVRSTDQGDAGVARVAAALRDGPGRTVPLRIETTATAINRDQTTLAALNLHGLGGLDLLFVALMSATAVAIFVFGLVLQRRREYVTLRALGIGSAQLRALLLGEAAVVAVSGLVIAGVVGTGMALMLVQVLRPLFVLPLRAPTVPAAPVLGLAALVLGTMALSSLVASAVIGRLRPVEILREE